METCCIGYYCTSVFYIAFFLVGLTNTVQTVIPTFAQYVLVYMFTPDCIEYIQYKAASADPVTGVVDSVGAWGCWHVMTWVSAVGPIIAVVMLLLGYKLRDKDVNLMAQCNNGEISREECQSQLSLKI